MELNKNNLVSAKPLERVGGFYQSCCDILSVQHLEQMFNVTLTLFSRSRWDYLRLGLAKLSLYARYI